MKTENGMHQRTAVALFVIALALVGCGGPPNGPPGGSGGGDAAGGGAASGSSATSGGKHHPSTGGSPGSGGSRGTGAGPTSDWGCADNGSNCLCYEPGGRGYDAPKCGSYKCCWYAEYPSGNECECIDDASCPKSNPDAKRVSSCPP